MLANAGFMTVGAGIHFPGYLSITDDMTFASLGTKPLDVRLRSRVRCGVCARGARAGQVAPRERARGCRGAAPPGPGERKSLLDVARARARPLG